MKVIEIDSITGFSKVTNYDVKATDDVVDSLVGSFKELERRALRNARGEAKTGWMREWYTQYTSGSIANAIRYNNMQDAWASRTGDPLFDALDDTKRARENNRRLFKAVVTAQPTCGWPDSKGPTKTKDWE